ncbi:MAG TPA: molybdate ABC transporter substrate-binding protein [Vicinamibacterales bacterium]
MKPLATGAVCLVLLGFGSAPAQPAGSQTLTVFAAASLHNAFTAIAERFKAAHPGVAVKLNFDGSQILETQIANGAPADVFASADQRSMGKAVDARLVGTPVVFARNSLVGIARFDTGGITSLRDFTRDGFKLAVCVETMPCGDYTHIALQKMSADPHYWKDYAKQVMHNVVSQELNVEAVLAKAKVGEVDGGFVYATDALHAGPSLFQVFPVPDEDQEIPTYPIAIVKNAPNASLAQAFVDLVLSTDGQVMLASDGFRHRP